MQNKAESPAMRSKTKRKLESEDKTKYVFISKPIRDISFINYYGHTDVSNKKEKQNREDELIRYLIALSDRDPINYQEAMTSKQKECWKKAVKDELDSM